MGCEFNWVVSFIKMSEYIIQLVQIVEVFYENECSVKKFFLNNRLL